MNTPGVNANAVKELVLCCLLLSSRPIIEASRMVQTLTGPNILEQAENKEVLMWDENCKAKPSVFLVLER